MLRGILNRFELDSLRALLEEDMVFRADDGDGGAGSSGGGGSSQEDDDGNDGDDDSSGDGDGDGSGDSDNDDDPAVRRANRQAAKARVALKEERAKTTDLEARLAKLESGGSGEDSEKLEQAEQARREAEEGRVKAEARLARIEREAVVTAVATTLGFSDPDIIVAMVESGRIEDLDPEEGPFDREDVRLALKDLKKLKPHLLGDGSSTREGGSDNRGKGTNGTRQTRSSEEIDKLPLSQRAHARLTRAFSTPK